jgi:hypothetical protein
MVYGEPETLGKRQDLHLQAAAKLARIHIRENFYEKHYQPRQQKSLSGLSLVRRNALNREAVRQLESLAELASSSPRYFALRSKHKVISYAQRKSLKQYPGTENNQEEDNSGLDEAFEETTISKETFRTQKVTII